MPKLWKPPTPTPAPDELTHAVSDVDPFVVQILYNRGLHTAAEIRHFIAADPSAQLGDPFALKEMDIAVERVRAAIEKQEKIAIYGDFDVDGICSAALLMQVLSSLGAQTQVYIPHRVDEGYGLNQGAIAHLADAGVSLLITADCGTSSVADIAYGLTRSVDTIVTDHHQIPPELPPALAVLNPHRPDSAYPFRDLAGVGVAYKLAVALLSQTSGGCSIDDYLDLVCLGTVVDVAPLLGENRDLVRLGLAAMRKSPRPGLAALMEIARVQPAAVGTGALSFTLGPRLNAAGRLDTAKTSYDLLLSESLEQARPLAQKLHEQNAERQRLLKDAVDATRENAAAQARDGRLIFVASAGYLAGIVGLVAGRLVEEFYRPAIAIQRGEDLSRGSCRSVPEFHMARALDECAHLLERHGGHAMAAGFTVRTERLPELQEMLAGIAQRELGKSALEPTLAIDCDMPLRAVSWPTRRALRVLEPFGTGNPAPLLQSNDVRVRSVKLVRGDSVQITVTEGSPQTWDGIVFRQPALASMVKAGDHIDIVYNLEDQTWNGVESLSLVIKDVHTR